jgi:hypothetical protein
MVEMGAPVVGDDPDRWAPPVGEREGGGRVGRWMRLGRGEEKEGEGGEWAAWAGWGRERVWGLVFFKSFFTNYFKDF